MIDFEQKVRERLEKQAAERIEEELAVRMKHAVNLIHKQAQGACGEHAYENHVRKATAYAEKELRKELEFDSKLWVEEELKKRIST